MVIDGCFNSVRHSDVRLGDDQLGGNPVTWPKVADFQDCIEGLARYQLQFPQLANEEETTHQTTNHHNPSNEFYVT
ncbi:hypothetical protein H5410_051805 [Solanum commersonii]|uniref:Uncharacterized protein n=1 Tax=Solanum commersonii TaxID=4109 RepID=A0A9J5WZJ2_SOLCO|nr:hypothetical protein H5410_051805 [Solanum commersonii]